MTNPHYSTWRWLYLQPEIREDFRESLDLASAMPAQPIDRVVRAYENLRDPDPGDACTCAECTGYWPETLEVKG